MPVAPYSRVLVAPSPALSGTTLSVTEDDGPRFPSTPFSAKLWPADELPSSTNSEDVVVLSRDGDELTIARGSSPVEIEAGMMIAAVFTEVYSISEAVTVSHDFGADDRPYTLVLRNPQGEIGAYGSATGVVDDGNGSAHFSFDPGIGGWWWRRWESPGQVGNDEPFFVHFSDTLS